MVFDPPLDMLSYYAAAAKNQPDRNKAMASPCGMEYCCRFTRIFGTADMVYPVELSF